MTQPRAVSDAPATKREAILRAALEVFGQQGFSAATLDEVAARAGVAKPTIYAHFGDKRRVLLEALRAGTARSSARAAAVIETTDLHPGDLRDELERLGGALVGCVANEESLAVIRLQIANTARFPDGELDELRESSRRSTLDRLAGKLAQIAVSGRLPRLHDPVRAAKQFTALVADDALAASGFGAATVEREVLDESVRAGVDTFLAAFGPTER